MKNLIVTAALLISFCSQAQITFDASYSGNKQISLDKFHVSGYKYTEVDLNAKTIKIYNINHSLSKTINIPTLPAPILAIHFISENLFDTDNLVEYGVVTMLQSGGPTNPSNVTAFYIYKENGTQMFFKDSANINGNNTGNIFNNTDGVFFDGSATKMKLIIQQGSMGGVIARTEIYTLPGSLPCSICTSGIITGKVRSESTLETDALFYPNPASDHLKLKYTLPGDYQNAQINIHDLQGKLIEIFKITNTFDSIFLPSSYNNGMYLYTLIVDGKAIKTEKIILNN